MKSTFLAFPHPLEEARFLARPNRFVVEAETAGGIVRAHLHDPGRMRELLVPGACLMLDSAPAGTGRSTTHTVRLVRHGEVWVSVDSVLPNRFMEKLLREEAIFEFRDWALIRTEVPHGRSRFDFLLLSSAASLLLEVKSVTLVRDGVALFPDAPTVRGARHLKELAEASKSGYAGTVFFLVQREDATSFRPNAEMDPVFTAALAEAFHRGVEIVAYTSRLSPEGIGLGRRIPVHLT